MTIVLFVIGFLDLGRSHSGAVWAQASLMDIWTFGMSFIPLPLPSLKPYLTPNSLPNDRRPYLFRHHLRNILHPSARTYNRNSDSGSSWGFHRVHSCHAVHAKFR